MRKIVTTIFIFISSFLLSQNLDSLTFYYINQYRIKCGKKSLTWSEDLHKTCIKHSNNMVINDSIYHSHGYTYSENVSYGKNSGLLITDGYRSFIKKYYNLSCDSVLKDVNTFCATQAVYGWFISKNHNQIMLSNEKYGAVNILLENLVKKSNIIFGQEFFKKAGPFYYKATIAGTFQIK